MQDPASVSLVAAAHARQEAPFDAQRLRAERELRQAASARLREAFPSIGAERFDAGVLRAVRVDDSPASVLSQLDHPMLASVDEVWLRLPPDTLEAWLAEARLARPLAVVHLSDMDATLPEIAALLLPFAACRELSLQVAVGWTIDGPADVPLGVELAALELPNLESLYVDCDATGDHQRALFDALLRHPTLRRVSLHARGKKAPIDLPRVLARLPSGVTELGLWQDAAGYRQLHEALLTSSVLSRLHAVGVRDDAEQIADPRLADKRLFGPTFPTDDALNAAVDLSASGRARDVIEFLRPLRWRTDDGNVWALYATSLSRIDRAAAIAAYQDALELEPDNAVALYNSSVDLVAEGQIEAAFDGLTASLVEYPDDAWLQRCLALAWKTRGNAAKAKTFAKKFLTYARKAVKENADSDTLYELACAHVWASETDKGLEQLQRALAAGARVGKVREDWEWQALRDDPRLAQIIGP